MELEILELITVLQMKMKNKAEDIARKERDLAMEKSDFQYKVNELEKLIKHLEE